MSVWSKKFLKNPIEDIEKNIKRYSSSEQINVLNGYYKEVAVWTPVQLLLFQELEYFQETLYFFIDKGIDLNLPSKKGINFYQLFLILFFYLDRFSTESMIQCFIDSLKFGFQSDQLIVLKPSKILSMLDCLVSLQEKDILPKSFFSHQVIETEFRYRKIEKNLFERLNLILLCYNCKFLYKSSTLPIYSLHINNIESYLSKYDFLRKYIIQKFKLPESIPPSEIIRRIKFLKRYEKFIPEQSFPKTCIEHYFNPEMLDNSFLPLYEFLSETDDHFFFHLQFFPLLYQTKYNPYTRQKIETNKLKQWKNEIKYNYPITTLKESLDIYPYMFSSIQENKNIFHSLFQILEYFFNVHHPYHKISSFLYMEKYEILYVGYVLTHETKLLKKFNKILKNPTIFELFKILFFYCQSDVKFINIIYFLLEEILQDIHCYKKLKHYLHNLDDNLVFLYDEYYARFGTYNPQFMKKFIENLIKIKIYENS